MQTVELTSNFLAGQQLQLLQATEVVLFSLLLLLPIPWVASLPGSPQTTHGRPERLKLYPGYLGTAPGFHKELCRQASRRTNSRAYMYMYM